jgi:hypothetical protein
MESTTRLGSSTIDRGTLTIREGRIVIVDADGNETIRIGLLDDGSYDIAAVETSSGEEVRLAALAFGQGGSFDTGAATITGLTGMGYTDPTTGTAGPTVTALVGESRRCKVTIGAALEHSFANPLVSSNCGISFECSGATTFAGNGDWSLGDLLEISPSIGGTLYHRVFRASYTHIFDPAIAGLPVLNPGLNTFKMMYRASPTGVTGNYADRLILVEPF